MMIDVDKLKEFVSKNWFMKSELGSIQVIDVKKIIDFINANQVEGIKGYCKDCALVFNCNIAKNFAAFGKNSSGYCSEFEPKELCTDKEE